MTRSRSSSGSFRSFPAALALGALATCLLSIQAISQSDWTPVTFTNATNITIVVRTLPREI